MGQSPPVDQHRRPRMGSPPHTFSCVRELFSIVARLFRAGALSRAALHTRGLVHRAIKPSDLWTRNEVTLCREAASKSKLFLVLTDPHTGKALVIANQSRNMRSNIKRSVNSAVRAAYRSLAAFFIDLRPK